MSLTKTHHNLKINLLDTSPDFFTRYSNVFNIIKKIQGDRHCTILDVGGRCGALGEFIKIENLPYHLTIIDIKSDDTTHPTVCDTYLKTDFLKKKVLKYDFIITLDTLEHITNKRHFINKILNQSRITIVSAPFDTDETKNVEKIANDFYKKYKKINHPWLKEHLKYGLPQETWFEAILKQQNYQFIKIESNNINNWLSFMLPNFFPNFYQTNNIKKLEAMNRFYNQNYKKLGDSLSPTYRKTYITSKNFKSLKIITPPKANFDPMTALQMILKKSEFFNEEIKSIQFKLRKNISDNNKLQNNVDGLEKKMTEQLTHANNLEHSLIEIKSSKFFKLWQIYNRIKKNPYLIIKGLKTFIREGPQGIQKKLSEQNEQQSHVLDFNHQYQEWFKKKWPDAITLEKQKTIQKNFKYRPKVSIITPVYNPDKEWLESCINSVIKQSYDNWELCLADDCSTKPYVREILSHYSQLDNRIKIVHRSKNGHISRASNSALKLATGEFIALLDNDDDLAPHALYKVVETLNQNSNIDLIYSDEDKIDLNGQHLDPFFKPDWSPDLLLSVNYFCHLCVIRKTIIDKIKGFRIGYEGSQDYDLFLRIIENTKNIYHLPNILYSWRKVPGSTATTYSTKSYANIASLKALNDAMHKRNIKAKVSNGIVDGTFRIKYRIIGHPKISIIIPTKDKTNYLKRCLGSVLNKTSYPNYEILVIDTGSTKTATLNYYQALAKNKKIKFFKWQRQFNFSSVNNFAVKKATGDYLVLLNNDTEIITADWLESMLEHAQRKNIGAVGAKLLYPNDKIQHAGIILGIKGGDIKRGVAGHVQKYVSDTPTGLAQFNSKDVIRNFSAVTAACIMINKNKYLEVGGLDEKFRIAFNDVDFCLKLGKLGYLNIYTPYAKLYHHESISVGKPDQGTRDIPEFNREIQLMIAKWDLLLENDPFYNPNLSLNNENFDIKT